MASQQHRPDRCRDDTCSRPPCVWFKEGYRSGYDEGFADGSRMAQA